MLRENESCLKMRHLCTVKYFLGNVALEVESLYSKVLFMCVLTYYFNCVNQWFSSEE